MWYSTLLHNQPGELTEEFTGHSESISSQEWLLMPQTPTPEGCYAIYLSAVFNMGFTRVGFSVLPLKVGIFLKKRKSRCCYRSAQPCQDGKSMLRNAKQIKRLKDTGKHHCKVLSIMPSSYLSINNRSSIQPLSWELIDFNFLLTWERCRFGHKTSEAQGPCMSFKKRRCHLSFQPLSAASK